MASLAGKNLVILGCGYVGTALAAAASRAGASVHALTRNAAAAAELAPQVSQVIVADLASAAWHGLLPGRVDHLVNCVSAGGGGIDGYRHSYLDGMHSIARWAASAAPLPRTFVYTSSTSVYPQGAGAVVDETAAADPATPTGKILREAETILAEAAGNSRLFVLRLAGIYGPGRHALLDQLRGGAAVMRGGRQRLNLAHRDDIVAALLACLAAPADLADGIFNVADGAPAPREELIRWLAVRLGRPTPAFADEADPRRRDGGPVPDRVISSAKLRDVLGWRPKFPDFRAGYESILQGG